MPDIFCLWQKTGDWRTRLLPFDTAWGETVTPRQKPFMRRMERFHRARYEEVVADAGYESLENYLYLESNGQLCFIKPANYDQKKSSKFKKQIGRIENMSYDSEEDCFTCVQGRKLPLRRECTELKDGKFITTANTAAKIVPDVPSGASAAEPKTQRSQRNWFCRRPFGKSALRPHSRLPQNGASICVCAAPSRWRAPLAC